MIRSAETVTKADWRNEPCVYECGIGDFEDHLTIEESVRRNFWIDGNPLGASTKEAESENVPVSA